MTVCIGQLHSITIYRTGFGMCAVLVLSVIMCLFRNSLIDFYFIMIVVTITGNFMAIIRILNYTFMLSETKYFWFCKWTLPWMFPPLDMLFEYWIEHLTFGLLYVMFRFSIRIFYRGVPGFATDCPCGNWCRGLNTCLLYVGPLFENLVWNVNAFVSLT